MVLKIWTIPRGRPQNPLRAAPRRSKSGAPQAGHQVKILNSAEIVPHTVTCTACLAKEGPTQRATRPWHAGVGNHAGSNSAGVLTATSTPTARLSRPLRVQNASMGSTMRVDWLWSLHPVPVNADVQGFLSSQDADVERQVPLVWLWRLH